MVSPRKPRIVLRRLRASPKSKGGSPEDWISASDFHFAEFPSSPVMETKNGKSSAGKPRKSMSGKTQNRRHSVLLKRLNLPVNSVNVSPLSNVRKTRRQSIAVTSTLKMKAATKQPSPNKLKTTAQLSSPDNLKVVVKQISPNKLKLIPRTTPELKVTAKPPPAKPSSQKLESSHPKVAPEKKRMIRSSSCSVVLKSPAGKRKMNSEISSDKMETASKKMNSDVPKIAPADKKPNKIVGSPSPNKKRILRSAIPKRAVRSCVLLASPLNKQKAAASPKPLKVVGGISVGNPKTPKKENKVEDSPSNKNNIGKTPKKENKVEDSTRNKINVGRTPKKENKVEDSPRKRNNIGKTPQKEIKLEGSPVKKSKIAVRKIQSPVSQKIQGSNSVSSPRKEKKDSDKEIKEKKTPILTRGMRKPLVKDSGSFESPKSKIKLETKLQTQSPKSKKLETVQLTSPKKSLSMKSPKQLLSPQRVKLRNTRELRSQSPSKQQKNAQSPQMRASKSPIKSPIKKAVISRDSRKISPDKKSTLPKTPKSLSKKSTASVTDSPLRNIKPKTPLSVKRLGTPTHKSRITRSSARKVTLIGESPRNLTTSFRKTPKAKGKSLKQDENGASPVLSARTQLELIRSRSPLRSQQKNVAKKMNPYTPGPDSPPSHVLRKTMKKKIAKKMYATTKVEVHQLMNGDISQPVKFISGTKTTTASVTLTQTKMSSAGEAAAVVTPRKPLSKNISDDIPEICVTASTPASASGLPPTPKSSRKKSDFMQSIRSMTSQTSGLASCRQSLLLATPRSSTPIEDDEIIEPVLSVDVIKPMDKESGFADVTINDDPSEDETSSLEPDEMESPTQEKKKRGYCALM